MLIAFVVALGADGASVRADPAVPEPDGYRREAYRAPVPETLQGATVLDTAGLKALLDRAAPVLVDVLPRPPRPAGLAAGTIWRPPRRRDIPGSHWLPNTGFGALSPEMERYFRDGLARLTAGDTARPLVFYCLADCWMSWNAAKRAIAYGFRNIIWFPGGVAAWREAGLEGETVTPWRP